MSVFTSLKRSNLRHRNIVLIAGLLLLVGMAGLFFIVPSEYSAKRLFSQSKPDPLADKTGQGVWFGISQDTEALPHLAGAIEYVKRRYRVSSEAVLPIFKVAELIGQERSIDPFLILAIIGVESGFNPFAESSMGARGLMQIMPRFHMDKVPEGMGVHHLFDPIVNIQVGVRVLEEAIRRRGGLAAGLQHYAGSSDPKGWYANKVLAEKARLEKAAGRKTEPEPEASQKDPPQKEVSQKEASQKEVSQKEVSQKEATQTRKEISPPPRRPAPKRRRGKK